MQTKRILAWSVSAFLAVAALLPAGGAVGQAAKERPECVVVRTAAPSTGAGYDHVVYVRNKCSVAVRCVVATNVDPEPEVELIVPSGQEKGVITRTHSKRRAFKSIVSCKRRAKAARADEKPVVARVVQDSRR